MIGRIFEDFKLLSWAIKASKIQPAYILFMFLNFILSLVLIGFLTSLGKKIFRLLKIRIPLQEELVLSLSLGIIFWGTFLLFLGILGILSKQLVWVISLTLFFLLLPELREILKELKNIRISKLKNNFEKILAVVFVLLAFLNLIGALTPEKGVDAIGYHLYFPKVYLNEKTMMLPARGSRLFSLFPHLASMIYLLPVSLNLPNVAQLFHFCLGVLTAITLGLISEKIRKGTFLTTQLIFYSPLVVGSISRSAYSDFFVTFFLSLSILVLLEKIENKVLLAGLVFGGTLATKNQSLALIPILAIFGIKRLGTRRGFWLLVVCFLVPIFWYLRSIALTGNSFYPFFSLKDPRIPELGIMNPPQINIIKVITVIKNMILIQPVLPVLLLAALFFKKGIFFLSLGVILYWMFLPDSFHDNRYFLPFLMPILILLVPIVERLVRINYLRLIFLGFFLILTIPRAYTNFFYLPYIFGIEEKNAFLSQALSDRPEDFYDLDKKFSKLLNKKDKILTDNVLGPYYLDYPFEEYEYSPFWNKKFSEEEFERLWKEGGYTYLLIKNKPITSFSDKIGLKENIFTLKIADEKSKTYLYTLILND